MKMLHILAALSGAIATGLLVASAHPLRDAVGEAEIWYVILGATVQLGCALAGLLVARSGGGRIAAAAGVMMVAGSAAFSLVLTALVAIDFQGLNLLVPIGGAIALLGWIVLAFAGPGNRT
jgi:uncharacterized membrane protein YgdD (TMEM256/DUF423 family)